MSSLVAHTKKLFRRPQQDETSDHKARNTGHFYTTLAAEYERVCIPNIHFGDSVLKTGKRRLHILCGGTWVYKNKSGLMNCSGTAKTIRISKTVQFSSSVQGAYLAQTLKAPPVSISATRAKPSCVRTRKVNVHLNGSMGSMVRRMINRITETRGKPKSYSRNSVAILGALISGCSGPFPVRV